MNILTQLPASMKERVSIKRIDAKKDVYRDADAIITVADNVECYIEPQNDEIQIDGATTRRWLRSTAYLGVPIPDIKEGDIVLRKDVEIEDGMPVFRVLPYGTEQMQLLLRTQGIL